MLKIIHLNVSISDSPQIVQRRGSCLQSNIMGQFGSKSITLLSLSVTVLFKINFKQTCLQAQGLNSVGSSQRGGFNGC